jgi:hypothetical protein
MSWLSRHEISEIAATDAHIAAREGNATRASELFRDAAEAESKAAEELDPTKTRTLGITVVSAVSLWFKGGELSKAEQEAVRWLHSKQLPHFADNQLRKLLQSIWTDQAMRSAGVSFLPGQVIVSIKGGQTVVGGAPLDLIVDKVQAVQALFYRTIEYLQRLPHRKRGGPPLEVQEACRPWLFQTQPGSYQFSVAIQGPNQPDLFKQDGPGPDQVADHFMSVLKASSEDPAELLPIVVPEADYRSTFLKLARNLAPTGKNFGAVEVREARETHGVVLDSGTRRTINSALRPAVKAHEESGESVELRGVLRALHLDKDWLLLWADGKPVQVYRVTEAVDDVIGPMVNRKVIVQAQRHGERYNFFDIEIEE